MTAQRRASEANPNQRLIVAGILALIGGVVLAWWGASGLFAAGVAADAGATGGGFPALSLGAAVLGTIAAVCGLCALAWQLGLMLRRRRARR